MISFNIKRTINNNPNPHATMIRLLRLNLIGLLQFSQFHSDQMNLNRKFLI